MKGEKVVSPVPPSGQVPEALSTENNKLVYNGSRHFVLFWLKQSTLCFVLVRLTWYGPVLGHYSYSQSYHH
jgi:hypothetical protein